MTYRFYITDVFTQTRFGGNQLAVLPEASGLTDEQMLQITREFNFSESTFVLPADDVKNTAKVRIFTPGGELPFAGHPNVGTAYVLAKTGAITTAEGENQLTFEEKAGLVPVAASVIKGEPVHCELTAPEGLALGQQFAPGAVAEALHLSVEDVFCDNHAPVEAERRLAGLLAEAKASGVHLYTRDCGEADWDLQARMYAPGMGVIEDPATGSANCALAAFLAHCDDRSEAHYAWRIAQGIEMGRPSQLNARVDKVGGELTAVRIGGRCVMVAQGELEV